MILVGDNNTKTTWILNFSENNGSLLLMIFMESEQLSKGEIAYDITVEHKNELILVFFLQYLL